MRTTRTRAIPTRSSIAQRRCESILSARHEAVLKITRNCGEHSRNLPYRHADHLHRSVLDRAFWQDRVFRAAGGSADHHRDHAGPRHSGRRVSGYYGTHKTPKVKNWLLRHPRFHCHFTPTYSSCLNLVERFFATLTEQQLRRGTHRSVPALENAIREYLRIYNEDPHPFRWSKSADEIIESVNSVITNYSDTTLAVLGTMTGLHQVGLTDEAASLTGSDASDAIEENGKID